MRDPRAPHEGRRRRVDVDAEARRRSPARSRRARLPRGRPPRGCRRRRTRRRSAGGRAGLAARA
ncbi:MAG: oxidoreductase [Chloroflexi bacterium]|nr:oxidoreductase [Chloroflexota bacterium]